MWSEPTDQYRRNLKDGLILRTPSCVEDVERLAQFHAGIHGPGVGPFVRNLLLNHPYMTPEDQIFVETESGEVVSALCLIPEKWDIDGALLNVGELGVVGTAEAFRRRGLVREQMVYFMDRLNQEGYVLSCILGIPYYYRQFGYDYALPLEGGYLLELRNIAEQKVSGISVRRAGVDDIDSLASMYDEAVDDLCISSRRDGDIWRYLMTLDDPADDMYTETWICEDADEAALGYMRVPMQHFGEELLINEAFVRRYEAATALLAHAKELAVQRKIPGIRMSLPASNYLVRYGLAVGARSMGTYAFQIHIPDKAALLKAMRPALEARLASTPLSSWSSALEISFYTDALIIEFEQGRITSIRSTAPTEQATVRMPMDAFMPLTLGYRSMDEMRATYPDSGADGEWRLLMDILFPKRESHINLTY